jgi:ankyrin repeat protein
MGKDTASVSFSGDGPQSVKVFTLCIAIAVALGWIIWYGTTRDESTTPQPFLSSPLLQAVRHRDRAAFIRELDRLPSVDAYDREGMTALLTVACCGKIDDLRDVLARKPDVNCANRGRGTPLMAVLWKGDAAAARLLLGSGADPRRVVWGGDCALLAAVRSGSEECVELTLAALGASPDDLFPSGLLENPLNGAVLDDTQEPILQRLLATGIDPNRAGANGQLPLVTAILARSHRSTSLLLRAGASADLPDGRGRMARSLMASDSRLAVAAAAPAPG